MIIIYMVKSKRVTKKKQIKTGGILADKNLDKSFYDFLGGSRLKLFSSGSNGVTFEATFTDKENLNAYVHSNYRNYGKPVKTLLVKLVLLNDKLPKIELRKYINNTITLETTKVNNFVSEVNIQSDIFMKSNDVLQPLCPSIVFAKSFYGKNDKQITTLITSMYNSGKNKETKNVLSDIMSHYEISNIHGIGIIGMEFIKSRTLHELHTSSNFDLYREMAMFCILRLALETEYHHADYHMNNIMISTDDPSYFYGTVGSPLLIDFGYTRKIPKEIMNQMNIEVNAGNYTGALDLICPLKRSDGLDLKKHDDLYGWVCNDFDVLKRKPIKPYYKELGREALNKRLDKLYRGYYTARTINIQKMNKKKQSKTRKYYPTLPLISQQFGDKIIASVKLV